MILLTEQAIQRYLGTSLSGLSSDLWELVSASYKYQRIYDDIVDDSERFITIGSAPFQEITSANGIFLPKEIWVDRPDGFYREKKDGYDY